MGEREYLCDICGGRHDVKYGATCPMCQRIMALVPAIPPVEDIAQSLLREARDANP